MGYRKSNPDPITFEVHMFVNVNGKRIFFDIVGEGHNGSTPQLEEKPVFLAVHCASGFDHGYLRCGIDILTMLGQVIYLDLPGSGRTGGDASEITFESLADDICEFMNVLGLNKVYLLGHCAGGFVSQIFALRYPEKLKGLILVNTAPSFEKIIEEGKPNPTLAERAPEDVVQACIKVYGQGIITPETVDECFHKVGPYFLSTFQMDNFKRVFSYTGLALPMLDRFVNHIYKTYDVREQLKIIELNTLVIAGKHDWLTPPSGARFIASQIKNSMYVEFDNSCHVSFEENRTGFIRSVSSYVKKNETGEF